ncbi:MAG: UDP-N-acetylmuramate dehydrogenase [Actinobacteria bacterium]|nr:UDP-N-acetylmuramate dehydrogenase [Actinomycetota bacterium]
MESQTGVPLSELTTLKLGGPAARLVECHSEADLLNLVRATSTSDVEHQELLLLAGGSNVVVADSGWPGTVGLIRTRGREVRAEDDAVLIDIAAGEPWDEFVAWAVDEGFAGVEALAGIPGLVGATPIQNVGAYGQDVASSIEAVRVLDRRTGEVASWSPEACRFGYRTSHFKEHPDRFVVLEVTFRLERTGLSGPIRYPELAGNLGIQVGDSAPTAEVRQAVLQLRRSKGMVLDPTDPDTNSAGSFFTNPIVDKELADRLPEAAPRYPAGSRVKLSAAWLIENTGFHKGYGSGAAKVSSKHTLALTNTGGATTSELLLLATTIRDQVEHHYGVVLKPEPVLVGCRL